MHLWMTRDPETRRVMSQPRAFEKYDFPPGKRGQGWPIHETDVEQADWDSIMEATITPDEAAALQLSWWEAAA